MPELPDTRMWGVEADIFCPGAPAILVPSAQLVRIESDRPQTWSFLFTVRIPDVLNKPNVDVRFEVSAGLGRATPILPMARLRCPVGLNGFVWTTVAFSAGLLDPVTDLVSPQRITSFPAQIIQCQAVVENAPSGGGHVFAGAYFAPLSHTPWIGPE